MTARLPAPVRIAAAKSTLQFDWLVPHKPSFSFKEVCAITGLSDSFIEKLFDAGRELSGHEYNGGRGERMTKRVPRTFLVALLIKSARYDAETKRDALVSCLREFGAADLFLIAEEARKLAGGLPLSSATSTGKN